MMYYFNGGFPGQMFGFGGILMFVFWILVIWGIIRLMHIRQHQHHHSHPHNNAMEILKARYAKGEITRDEFEAMKKDIQ